jgi:hypothetical protein
VCTSPASGATNFPDRLWNRTRTYDTIEFTASSCLSSSEEVSLFTVLAKHHLRLFEKLFYFITACLARVVSR